MPRCPDGTYYETHGPADGSADAPVVVMIHGLGLNHAVWQWQVPALAARYRVVSYDIFGHGDSPLPPADPSLTLFSAQLTALMDHLSIDRAALVGFSLGGMIARRVAQDAPDRVGALAILHSQHRRSPAAQQAILDRVAQAREQGAGATVEAALDRWFTQDFRAARPDMMDLVRSWVLANDIAVYHRNYRVLATGIEEIVAPEPPISVPALVVTGDEDFGNDPEMTRAIAAEIPGAEVLILKGQRHMALAEVPDVMNPPLLSFLDRAIGGAIGGSIGGSIGGATGGAGKADGSGPDMSP